MIRFSLNEDGSTHPHSLLSRKLEAWKQGHIVKNE